MQLHHGIEAIRGAGAELHVIGNGAPMFMAGFRETTGFAGPLYTDPSLEIYRAAELRRGLASVFTLGTLSRSIGSLRRGFRQGRIQGDALQQGGALVVDRDGSVRWHHISKGPGDNASVAQILAALGPIAATGNPGAP